MAGIELDKIKVQSIPSEKSKSEASSLTSLFSKDISLFGNILSDKKKEKFYSELHVLISSGIDIKTVLEIIEEEQEKKSDKELFGKIRERVVGGMSLSHAMEKEGLFSSYEVFSLRIGEESGRMSEVLHEQTIYFSKKIKQKRQLVQALSYPAVVLTVAFGVMFFMLRFIVPMFRDVFKQFGADLPYITKVVIRASYFVTHYGFYAFLTIMLCIIFLYSQRKTEWLRKSSASFFLKIPFMGNMLRKIYLARFCQAMNLLLSSRTQLINAIELVENMVGFYPIEKSMKQIKNDVEKGQSLYKSLSAFNIYPRHLISLIKVAEEVNQLDVMFGRLAKQYSDEVEHETGLINSVIEPVLMIFLGLFVGIILLSIYLPMFKMGMAIH